jgi:hypothetical protein
MFPCVVPRNNEAINVITLKEKEVTSDKAHVQVTTQYSYIIASTVLKLLALRQSQDSGRWGKRVWRKSTAGGTQLAPNVTGSICVHFRIYYDRTLQQGRKEHNDVNVKGE